MDPLTFLVFVIFFTCKRGKNMQQKRKLLWHRSRLMIDAVNFDCLPASNLLFFSFFSFFFFSLFLLSLSAFSSLSPSPSSLAPRSVKMIPVWEFTPTAVTTIFPDPSITWVPERSSINTVFTFSFKRHIKYGFVAKIKQMYALFMYKKDPSV